MASGNLGAGLSAGESVSLSVSLDTTTAGIFSSTADLNFVSHNDDLADLNLGSFSLNLAGQVNNYANGSLLLTGGAGQFSQLGMQEYLLDFGDVIQGSGLLESFLALLNDVQGPADLLDVAFDFGGAGAGQFIFTGFSDINNLVAGDLSAGLGIQLNPLTLGLLDDTIVLNVYGHNDSGYRALEETLSLRIVGNVVAESQVPEPGILFLEATAFLLMLCFSRRSA